MTVCKDCIFAQTTTRTEPDQTRTEQGLRVVRTQHGCFLGRVEQYRKVDPADVEEAYNDEEWIEHEVDGQKLSLPLLDEFFSVRTCNFFHKEKDNELDYAEGLGIDRPTYLDGLANQIAERVALRVALIVPIETKMKKDGLTRLCNSLKALSVPPLMTYFVGPDEVIRPLGEKLNGLLAGAQLNWRLLGVMDTNDLKQYQELTGEIRGRLIDMAVSKLDKGFSHYSVFYPGRAIPADFFKELNESINTKLLKWTILSPNKYGNGLTVQLSLHRDYRIGGNSVMDIGPVENAKRLWLVEEKVRKLLEDEKKSDQAQTYIKMVGEVCKKLR